jgi:hypothetical protein
MTRIDAAQVGVQQATELPAVLDASYMAFEAMLSPSIRSGPGQRPVHRLRDGPPLPATTPAPSNPLTPAITQLSLTLGLPARATRSRTLASMIYRKRRHDERYIRPEIVMTGNSRQTAG